MLRKIMIYEGMVRKLYAEGVHLEKEHVVPMVKKEIIRESSLYYPSFGNLINMEYDMLLPTEEEAIDYMNHIVGKKEELILDYLTNPKYSSEEQQNLLHLIASISSCVYFNSEEAHPFMEISKKDFKELKKTMAQEHQKGHSH